MLNVVQVDPRVTLEAPAWVIAEGIRLLEQRKVDSPDYLFHDSPREPANYIKMVIDTVYAIHVEEVHPKEGKRDHHMFVYFDGTKFKIFKYFPNTKAAKKDYNDMFSTMVTRHLENRKAVMDKFVRLSLQDPLEIRRAFEKLKKQKRT